MWKTWTPARTKVSCQECQRQRLPQNWTFPQSLPEQDKSHPASQLCSDDNDTHTDENGVRQPNPPARVNMFEVINHIEANSGKFNEEKHLKFHIASHPKGPCNHHIVVRVDTGADVNCMNEKTFNAIFPEVQLPVCSHEIQNFRNSVADISILGQFHSYLELRREK